MMTMIIIASMVAIIIINDDEGDSYYLGDFSRLRLPRKQGFPKDGKRAKPCRLQPPSPQWIRNPIKLKPWVGCQDGQS